MNPKIKTFLERYQKDGLVFKSCDTYIVALQKLKDTITNEDRKVHNKNRAIYRGNKFRVIDIVSKVDLAFTLTHDEEKKEITEVNSDFTDNFVYIKNEIVECKNYKNTKNVYAPGIHYYTLWSSAFYHNLYKVLLDKKYENIYTGKDCEWYDDGKLMCESNILNGQNHGIEECWHENGNLRSIETWKNGKKDGVTKVFYENGQQFSELNYIDGHENGPIKFWHENGIVSEIHYYKNGVKHGSQKIWNKKGQLIEHYEYKNGFRYGKSYSYYDNGLLKQEETYNSDGFRNGIYRMWDKNGTLREEITYKNSIKHGPYKIWNAKGRLVKAGMYGNDGNIACTMNPSRK